MGWPTSTATRATTPRVYLFLLSALISEGRPACFAWTRWMVQSHAIHHTHGSTSSSGRTRCIVLQPPDSHARNAPGVVSTTRSWGDVVADVDIASVPHIISYHIVSCNYYFLVTNPAQPTQPFHMTSSAPANQQRCACTQTSNGGWLVGWMGGWMDAEG